MIAAVAILLLLVAFGLYWPPISGHPDDQGVRKISIPWLQMRYGDRWRTPLALAMTAAAVLLLIFAPASEEKEAANRATTPEPRFAVPPHQENRSAVPAKATRKHSPEPIQVIAMSNNRAAILEDGEIVTLNTGQQSPQGWQLSSASPRHAVLISPDGRRFIYGNPPQGDE